MIHRVIVDAFFSPHGMWKVSINLCNLHHFDSETSHHFKSNFSSLSVTRHVSLFQKCCHSNIKINLKFRFRFKIALLLPIKHRIIYITVKSTWNVNTSTNTAMHYHGSKGSWKSCRIYGLLVCYTYSKYISTGVQRVQQKKKKHKMTLPVIMYQQHMRYMTSTLFN